VKKKPAFVFANFNDHAFAKISLDQVSEKFVRENMEKIMDPFLRQLLWCSLFDMVRDQFAKATDFLELVGEKLRFENDMKLTQTVVDRALAVLENFVPDSLYEHHADLIFHSSWKRLVGAEREDEKIIFAKVLIRAAATVKNVTFLTDILDKPELLPNFELDQDMRWSIAVKAKAFDFPNAEFILERELARDPSDRGQRRMMEGSTAGPSIELKAKSWNEFQSSHSSLSHHMQAAQMSGFRHRHQKAVLETYTKKNSLKL